MRCGRLSWCSSSPPSLPPAESTGAVSRAAFDWQGVVAPANFRVDAWVTPPPYTARPPILLPGMRAGEPDAGRRRERVLGSRWQHLGHARDRFGAARRRCQGRIEARREAEKRASRRCGRSIVMRSLATAPPSCAAFGRRQCLLGVPRHSRQAADHRADQGSGAAGARQPAAGQYKLEDDYGVVGAKATFARKARRASEKDAQRLPTPLFDPPEIVLLRCRRRAPAKVPARPSRI